MVFSETAVRQPFLTLACFLLTPTRWSYGANRVQLEADIKILNDFLTLLQTDSVRASHLISSSMFPIKTSIPGRCVSYNAKDALMISF